MKTIKNYKSIGFDLPRIHGTLHTVKPYPVRLRV
jgi:hypothetical protein